MKNKLLMPALVVRTVVITALFGAVFLCPHALRAETSKSDVPAGVSASDWQGIRAAHEAWKHEVRKVDGGWEAQNPAQQWTTTFDGRGFVANPANADWSWGLELRAYGAGAVRRAATGAPDVKTEGQRLAYHWDDTVQEWFVNDGRGLEHGFSVQERPPGPADAPLSFLLVTRGPLIAKVTSDARAVDYRTAAGSTVLTYSGLRVWDADGRDLPSRFVPAEGGVELQVDATGARYPVTIDPIARQAYLKASNTGAFDQFSYSLAVSGDTLVVGAPLEDSSATGVDGNQADNSGSNAGAAYVFVLTSAGWTQQAYLKGSNTGSASSLDSDNFGASVAITGDTLVVGAPGESSAATGINGNESDNSAQGAGAAYVFVRTGTTWSQQAYLKASNSGANDGFGNSVAISGDTVVVGASRETSGATGVDSNQYDNSAYDAGAAYVFARIGTTWTQQAYLKASNTEAKASFGFSVAISGDSLAVGAPYEDGGGTGVNGDQTDNSGKNSGAVYVFARNGTAWEQEAYLKASNTGAGVEFAPGIYLRGDAFGWSLGLSGNTLVVGAVNEDSGATGVNGDQGDNGAKDSGAAYVFVRSNATWSQQAYLKASNTNGGDITNSGLPGGDQFGFAVAILDDTVMVSAPYEDSNATGVDGDQTDNSALNSGAVYVFRRAGETWTQRAYFKASNTGDDDLFGHAVAIAGDMMMVGAPKEDSSAIGIDGSESSNDSGNSGAAYVFDAISNDASLASLGLSDGSLSPAFGDATTHYQVALEHRFNQVAVTPTVTNFKATASVRINGGAYTAVASGSSSGPLALNVGSNTVEVQVTAQDGTTSRTYTLTVWRDATGDPVTMDVVTVGDTNNTIDSNFRGSVDYDYFLGQYEVTVAQYAAFLNTVARRNTFGYIVNLWEPAMATNSNVAGISRTGTGATGDLYAYSVIGSGNRPIAYLSWLDAARFANWMHNGAMSWSSTETGAYTLNGATNDNNSGVRTKNPGAKWWVPSSDEWYKAAYYKGRGTNTGYWEYPTQSDAQPGNVMGSLTNQANYYDGNFAATQSASWAANLNYLTDVGAFPYSASAYGTFDQGGNVSEWVSYSTPSGDAITLMGGWWGGTNDYLRKSFGGDIVNFQQEKLGFRVAGAADSRADLGKLDLGVGLDPLFAGSRSSYVALVPFSKSSVVVTPEAVDAGAAIQVRANAGNYASVAGGGASSALPLNVGLNNLHVRVAATNGLVAKTYSIVVARGSSNANLSSLTLSSGSLSPSFPGSTQTYAANVVNEVGSITVTPTLAQADATIQVRVNGGNYSTVSSGVPSGALALNVGSNTVELKVTAQNVLTTKTYTVSVTRLLSSNANLGSLNLSAGLLSPPFSGASNYTAGVDFSTKSINVTPNVAQANATVQVRLNGGAYFNVTSGVASGALALGVGNNTIEVKVTAQDGTTTKTYTLNITRAPMPIETVAVGDEGNAPDVTGYGAVSYPYRIGKYEITLGEYAEFLNAVAKTSDPYGLYPIGWGGPELMRADVAGISRDYSNGVYTYTPVTPIGLNPVGANSPANRPVSYMTLFNAARFANWLANGQPSGGQDATTTEDGAYALNGATSGSITRNATNPNTGAPPAWWIPTENEWYKAAYYKGGGTDAGYWLYPTQSDTKPGNTIGGVSNQANHKLLNGAGDAWVYSVPNVVNALYSQNALTDVGAFSNSASAYGTFDQGGNVWEWSYVPAGDSYPIRGGDYGSANTDSRDFLKSSADQVLIPANWKGYSGFRVASAPMLPPRIVTMTRGLNGFSLSWADAPNVHVQRRTSLSEGSWQTISSNNITGSYLDLATPTSRAFYRLILP